MKCGVVGEVVDGQDETNIPLFSAWGGRSEVRDWNSDTKAPIIPSPMRRALQFYTKYFVVWIVLCGIAAYILPGPFLLLGPHMKLFFGLTMFGIGAVLEPDDFKRIAARPGVVLIGSAAQFIIMPLGAFLLCRLFDLPQAFAVGLILAGSAPGAMASNVMCYVARADTAYSVSLTTVSTLLCPVLTPVLTKLLARSVMHVEFWAMFWDVMRMVIVPLIIGFLVRMRWTRRIDRITPVFPAISATFIILICALVVAANRARLGQVTVSVLAVVAILNLYGMLTGYGVGKLFRMQVRRRRTLSIEIGMQNAGLGTVLALTHFGEQSAIPTAVFVFVCLITASVMAGIWSRDPPPASRTPPGRGTCSEQGA